jgi:hypothetical protein
MASTTWPEACCGRTGEPAPVASIVYLIFTARVSRARRVDATV